MRNPLSGQTPAIRTEHNEPIFDFTDSRDMQPMETTTPPMQQQQLPVERWLEGGDLQLVITLPAALVAEIATVRHGSQMAASINLKHYLDVVRRYVVDKIVHGNVEPDIRPHLNNLAELVAREES